MNILPECDTVLHRIYSSLKFVERFCEIAKEKDQKGESQFYIPFNSNIDGKTPLHMCLGINRLAEKAEEAKGRVQIEIASE